MVKFGAKVLYFHNKERSGNGYFELYKLLKSRYNGRESVTVNNVDKYLFKWFGKTLWYLKEKLTHIELYNLNNEYIFCINKPIKF